MNSVPNGLPMTTGVQVIFHNITTGKRSPSPGSCESTGTTLCGSTIAVHLAIGRALLKPRYRIDLLQIKFSGGGAPAKFNQKLKP